MTDSFPKTIADLVVLNAAVQRGSIMLTKQGEDELLRKFGLASDFYNRLRSTVQMPKHGCEHSLSFRKGKA